MNFGIGLFCEGENWREQTICSYRGFDNSLKARLLKTEVKK